MILEHLMKSLSGFSVTKRSLYYTARSSHRDWFFLAEEQWKLRCHYLSTLPKAGRWAACYSIPKLPSSILVYLLEGREARCEAWSCHWPAARSSCRSWQAGLNHKCILRQAIQKLRSHFSVCWPQFLLPLPMCLWFGICRHTAAVQFDKLTHSGWPSSLEILQLLFAPPGMNRSLPNSPTETFLVLWCQVKNKNPEQTFYS